MWYEKLGITRKKTYWYQEIDEKRASRLHKKNVISGARKNSLC